MKHCRKVHTTPYTYRCLASLFTKRSTRKLTQTTGLGLLLLASALTTPPVSAQTVNICSRTPLVETRILANIPGTDPCNAVTATQLAAITSLNLNGDNISTLQAGDFAGLTALTSLNLGRTSLSTLPNGIFNGLTSLTTLTLSDNTLNTLNANVFAQLTSLTTLQLNGNSLTALPAGLLTGLTSLATLRLQNNPLTTPLPADIFNDLANFPGTDRPRIQIDLTAIGEIADIASVARGTSITINAAAAFIRRGSSGENLGINYSVTSSDGAIATANISGAGQITLTVRAEGTTTITVTGNVGSRSPTQTFSVTAHPSVSICSRTTEIQSAILAAIPIGPVCSGVTAQQLAAITNDDLTLNASSITSLQAGDFAGLSGITVLNLSGNMLTTLPDNTLSDLTSLTGLNLSGNDLDTLSGGALSGLSALTSLNLSGNSLTTLPANVFSDLGMLTVLNLRSNAITTLPANAFSGLDVLPTLDLRDSTLSTLPVGVFTGLDALTELNLRATSLTTLPADVFDPISTLTILDLQFNSLSTLPNDLFDSLSALARLNLNNNGLSALPSSLSDLTMLSVLNLNNNNLGTLQADTFSSLTALTSLNLANTGLSTLPDGLFDGLTLLDTLRLHTNPITTPLPANIFSDLPAGEVIHIDLESFDTDEVVLGDGDTRTLDLSNVFISRDGGGVSRTLSYTIVPSAPSVATASVSANMLTITGNGIGTTMISITADDDPGVNARDNVESIIAVRVEGVMSICDRTATVESAILAAISPSPACDDVTMTQLANITSLTLDSRPGALGADTPSLQSGDFAGLSGLIALGINRNTLSALPADIFSGLSNLETLSLADNMLTALPVGLFSDLTSLTALRLQNNNFAASTPLPADLFEPLPDGVSISIDLSPIGSDFPDIALTVGTTTTLNIANAFVSIDPTSGERDLTYTITPGGSSVSSATESGGVVTITANDRIIGPAMVDVSIAADDGTTTRTRLVTVVVSDIGVDICDRTPEIQTAILNAIPSSPACADVMAGQLAAINSLNVSGITIAGGTLLPGDFAGLSSLTTLNLRGTQLTTVPSGAFTGLSALTTLSLWNTGLSTLPADLFDPLSTLTTLHLQQNSLSALPDDLFDSLTSITTLNLNNNSLSALPSSLSALTTLTTLNLNNNVLGTLESDVFSMLTALTSLNLANTGLSALPDGLFDSLTLLATLRLHGNTFTTPLPVELFDDLPTGTGTLVQIDLTLVGDIAVALDTSGTRTITLADAFISRNNTGMARPLSYVGVSSGNPAVATVSVDAAGVLTITAAANGATTVSVTAADGTMTTAPDGMTMVPTTVTRTIAVTVEGTMSICDRTDEVEAVILAAIPGTPLCDAVTASQLASITGTLNLGSMSISTLLPGDFAGLSSLTLLNLRINDLTTLPARVFAGLTSLTELNLRSNTRLSSLPVGLFNGLTNLADLSLFDTAITTPLPADIFEPLPDGAVIYIDLSPIGDHAVALGTGGTTTIDLEETFISRNFQGNDRPILYGAVSSNDTNVATVTRSGLIVTIRAVAPGTTTVSIIANDGFGDVTRTIAVTVSNTVVSICSRTAQVRSAILAAIPGTSNCAAVTEAQLASIRSLVVSGTVGSLQAGDFAGLSALTSLNLADTSLTTLPANLFDGLTRLSMLRLQDNSLTALPVDIFDPLADGVLIEIDLSSFNRSIVLESGTMIMIDLLEVFISRDENGNDRPLSYSGVTITGFGSATESGGVLSFNAPAPGTGTVSVTADDGTNTLTQVIQTRAATEIGICDRSAEVQSVILAAIPGVDNCLVVTPAQLAAITGTLALQSMSISALLAGDFAGLSSLTELNLTANSLSTLPDNIFDDLTSLTFLTFLNNPLTALPDNVFDNLTNLTLLDLGNSSLSTLPTGIFNNLTNLTTLGLSGSPLTALEAGVFSMLTNLTSLGLSNTSLSALPAGLFSGLTNLRTLSLLDNTFTTPLPADIFDDLPDTAAISINAVAIGVLADVALTVGDSTTINVANAFIARGFDGLDIPLAYSATSANPAIATASANGEVVTISKIIFGTTSISIVADAGFGFTATQTVTVATPDTTVGICDRTAEVQSVILAAISATNDCAAVTVGQLARITGNLFFPASTLSAALLPGDFDGLTGLTQLNLNSNTLGTLPSGIFDDLISLTSLGIAATELTALDADVFASLTSLTTLIANDNMLSALPAGLFEGLTSLATLQLHDNTITTPLPADIFDPLPATGRIQIDATPIGILPDIALMVGGTTTINVSNAFIHRNSLGDEVGREYGFVSSDATVASVTGGGTNGITTVTALTNGATTITASIADTGSGSLLGSRTIKVTVDASVMDICDRTPEIEAAILAAISPTPPCNGVTPAQLTAITGTLNLSSMSIASLQAGDFTGLSSLTILNLSSNSLSTLPDGLFTGLGALTTLSLAFNSLSALPANLFDDLTSLTSLNLAFNSPLTMLPPGVFDNLTSLTILALNNNGLSTLPMSVFDELTSLTSLNLALNSLTTLPMGVFDELTSLTFLDLSFNNLTTLPAGVFNNLASLETLSLNNNSLSALPSGIFDNLGSLTSLTLNNNMLSALPMGVFDNLGTLTFLQLNNNSLTALETNVFSALSGITTLDLRDNSIATINANTFNGLSGVTTLNLSNNNLTMLAANAFNGLSALTELDLFGNSLSALPANVFDNLTNLADLQLSGNALTTLPAGVFDNLRNLTFLNLLSNDLETLPDGLFDNLTSLTDLLLNDNSLNNALEADMFSALTNLRQLALGSNGLTALPAGLFNGLDSLTSLSLSNNPITTPLPADIFDDLPDSARVEILATPIGDIPDITLTVGGITTININNTFFSSDDDGPRTLTYSSSFSGGVADHSSSGTVVTLRGTNIGTGNLQIRASGDARGVVRRDVPVTVTEVVSICDRTAQVRDAILAAIPSPAPACADVFASQLSAIDSLDLSGSITSLKIGDFDRLSGLTSLDLSGSSTSMLSTLPDNIFDPLTSLTTLSLNNNALSALEADVFSTLTGLTSLTLHANALTALPDGLFSGLGSLATLRLQGNTFTTALPATLFADLPSDAVIEIDLSPFGDLADISSLTVGDSRMVDVSGAFISKDAMGADRSLSFTTALTGTSVASATVDEAVITITASTTPGAASVAVTANDGRGGTLGMSTRSFAVTVEDMTVDICDRTDAVETAILTAISATSPPACTAVTATQLAAITGALNLQSMSISTLLAGDFDGLTGLTELRLFDNSLSALPDNIFNDLRNLTLLSLSLNRISMLPTGVFDNLTSLTGLFLAGNSLSALNPNVFSTLTSLTTLDLGSNDLSTLPANLFDMLSNLTTLRLNGNDLTALPDGLFSGLTSLATLRLFNNAFTTRLPADIFDPLPDAAVIEIDLSPIGDLPSIPSLTLGGVTTINVTEAFISRDLNGVDRDLSYNVAVNTGMSVSDVTEDAGVITITASSTITGTANVRILAGDGVGSFTRDVAVTVVDTLVNICDRTMAVQTVILAAIPGSTTCDAVTERQLAAITGIIDLFDMSISALLPGDFDGLTSLGSLFLDNNSLTTLPSGIFSDLGSVTVLTFANNSLTTLPAGAFAGLTSLPRLDLNSNALTTIEANAFSGLTSVTSLDLGSNALTAIEDGIFNGLTSLTSLLLSANSLSTIEADTFSALTSLTTLDLQNNSIATINANAFSGLTRLTILRLNGNTFTTPLPANLFDPLPDAAAIQIDLSPIGNLADVMLVIDTGRTLDVTDAFISRDNFGGDRTIMYTATPADANVATVSLSSGGVGTITAGSTPDTMTTINIVADDDAGGANADVTRTITVMVLPDIVNICSRTTQVETAILTAISATSPPACDAVTSTQLATITSLDLSSASISTLQADDFAGLIGLTSLNLSGNTLSTLPANLFNPLTSLTTLSLNDNSLSTLPADIFDMLSNLTGLSLASNDLSALPAGVFNNLMNLETLFLESNALTMLPANAFSGLTGLTTLNLSSNVLSTLPANIFDPLMSLSALQLNGNSISMLEANVFSMLTNLRTLNLSNNSLTTLPAGLFTGRTILGSLRLQGNAFTALPADIFGDISSLATIQIDVAPIGDLADIPSLSVSGTTMVTVSDAFISRDSAGDDRALSFTVTPVTPAVATASESGGVVTIEGVGAGTTDVTVTATDVSGTATQTISVTVVNVGIVAYDAMSAGNQISTFTIADENSGTAMFYVELQSAPVGDVIMSVTSSDATEGTVLPATLTFTTANWNMRQAITVTAVDDSISDDDSFMVDFAITTGDGGNYLTTTTLSSVTVAITDDETVPTTITLSGVTPLTVAETADATEITITATIDGTALLPTDTIVTVSVGGGMATSGTDYTAVPDFTLTIPALSLSATGTFMIDPTEDSTDDNNETVMISGTAGGFTVNATTLTILEAGISVHDAMSAGNRISTVTIADENSGTTIFYVQLLSLPVGDVIMSVTSDDTAEGTVMPTTLTFTSTNWDTRQAITVTAVPDDIDSDSDDSFMVDFAVTTGDGGNYTTSLDLSSVTVTITDDDTAGIALFDAATAGSAITTLTTTEGATTDSFYVVLESEPTAEVTVALTSGDPGEGTITTGASLTFDSTNWDTPRQMVTVTGVNDDVVDGDQMYDITLTPTGGGYGSVTAPTVSVTNSDDDTADLSIADMSVDENAGTATVTVTLSAMVTAGTVEVDATTATITGDTATAGTDYTAITSQTLTFAAGSTSETLNIPINDDSIDEVDETFTVMLDNLMLPTGLATSDVPITDATATVTITDDDTLSDTINLSVSPLTVAETADTTTITVTATIDGTAVSLMPTTVTVSVGGGGGTATSGADYAAVGDFTLNIPALSASGMATFMIDPTEDTTDDNNETVMITGTAPGFTTVNAATLTIVEAGISVFDAMTAGSQTSTTTIAEASGTGTLYVQLTSEPAASSSVTISVASSDTNEGMVTPATLTFSDTNWNTRQAITVTAVPDNVDRDDTFTVDFAVTGGDGGNYTTLLTLPSVTVTITDDDTVSNTINLSVSPLTVAETADATTITVTATIDGTAVSTTPTVVTVSVGGGTATSGTDYVAVGDFTLTIPALSLSAMATFMIDPTEDTTDDNNETVMITGAAGGFATINPATLTIVEAGISVHDAMMDGNQISTTTIAEASGTGMLYVQLTSEPAASSSVTISVASSAMGEGTVSTPTLTFSDTNWDTRQLITVTAVDDNVDRDDTFMVNFAVMSGDGGNYTTSLTLPSVAVTITDDDTVSDTIGLSISPLTVAETADATTITVTATIEGTAVSTMPTVVTVSVGDSSDSTSATEGTDYATIADFDLTISALSLSATGTFMIDPTEDTTDDNNETVMIAGTAPGFTTVNAATLTIVEAGISVFDAMTLGNQISTTTIAEASGTGTLYVQLASEPAASSSVTISVASSDMGEGTVSTPTLTFSDTNWDTRQLITVTAVDDNVDRDDSFTVDFMVMSGDGGNYTTSLTLPSVAVTITDDDTVSDTIGLSVSPSTVAETAASTEITVTATIEGTAVSTMPTTVTVSVGGGTATSGTDYATVTDFTLTIPVLSLSGMTTFMIDPTEDTTDDNNETVMISGAAPGFTTVNAAALTIVEAGISVFDAMMDGNQISTATIAEASGTGMLYVQLASEPETGSSVTISVTSSDTNEGTVSTPTLTFSDTNWDTRQLITVTAVDDDVDRDDTFTVDFAVTGGDGGNYTTLLTLPSVTVTITDDDTVSNTINLSVSPLSIPETADATTITVTATIDGTAVSTTGTTVTVSVGGGTATSGTDYTAVSDFTLTIPALSASGMATFMIDPTEDTTDDNNETVTITGTAPGSIVNPATLTIVEAGISVFNAMSAGNQISTVTIAEASGTGMLYVQLASPPETGSSVTISVASSDTNEGTVSTPTLTFSDTNWDDRQLVTVTAVDDNVERDDTFTVNFAVMSGDSGNYTSSLMLPSVMVTITDDDDTATNMINLSVSPDSILETDGATTITVTATIVGATSSTMDTDVTVTVGGTAMNEATVTTDYTATPSTLTITVSTLTTSATGTFSITPVADDVNDNGEIVTIRGTSGSLTVNDATLTIVEFSREDQQAIEQTVAATASGVTQVVTEQIGIRLASRTLAGSAQERQSLSAIDWQDRLAKFTYEGLKHLDSEADMSLDWLLRAAGGNGQLVMPLGAEAVTLWATGGRISTKGDGVADYDGDVNSFILGIDTDLANDWLAGIAISYNDSEVDYTMDGTPEAKTEQTLYGIHPYLSRTVSKGLTLWATGGYGFGDIDFSDTRFGNTTSDITQWMAAGGLEQQIITNSPWQGAVRIKGLWGNAEVDATEYSGGIRIAKIESDFWRAHMESEMGYNFPLPGGKIRPYAIIGGRWDHNDAIVSGDEWHVDVGGGVEVIRPAFTLNISVRTQVTEGDTEEDSIFATGSLTYDLEQDGRGLQIALSRPLNNTSPAFDSHSFNEVTESGLSGAPLTSELAYGWTVHPFGLKGALQTYVQNSFDSDDRHYAVGLELAVNALTLNFETGYHTNLDSETDGTGLESMLKTKIRW